MAPLKRRCCVSNFPLGVLTGITLFLVCDYLFGPPFRLPTCLPRRAGVWRLASAPAPLPPQTLRWYTSINSDSLVPMLAAALRSMREFDGLAARVVLPPDAVLPGAVAAAARRNATIVRHEVLFGGVMKRHMLEDLHMSDGEVGIALASFLRVDAAILAASESLGHTPAWVRSHLSEAARTMAARDRAEDTVLYTDSDMLFLGPVARTLLEDVPLHGAFAVRRDGPRSRKFNPAVMLIRVSRFLTLYEDILAAWHAMRYECIREAWDQGCLVAFVASRRGLLEEVAVLPQELHTTPYDVWVEGNPPVQILHFHGPKPDMLLDLLSDAGSKLPPHGYSGFVTLKPQGYLKALMLYAAFADPISSTSAVDSAFTPWCKAHPGLVAC